eukprot:jgi/Bigna1/68815/fgenesh1_pg.7_\
MCRTTSGLSSAGEAPRHPSRRRTAITAAASATAIRLEANEGCSRSGDVVTKTATEHRLAWKPAIGCPATEGGKKQDDLRSSVIAAATAAAGVHSSNGQDESMVKLIELQALKIQAVQCEDFERAQTLKEEIDSVAEDTGLNPVEAEAAALEMLKARAVDNEDYKQWMWIWHLLSSHMVYMADDSPLAQAMKERLEALRRRPPSLMKKKKTSTPPSHKLSIAEQPREGTRAVSQQQQQQEITFESPPWCDIVPVIAAYKGVSAEELKLRLEHLRMALFDVDVFRHPKSEVLCLLAATIPVSNVTAALSSLQAAIPGVNPRHLAARQLWILRESPEAILQRVRECREILLGVRNFTELVTYNPNLLDTSALKITLLAAVPVTAAGYGLDGFFTVLVRRRSKLRQTLAEDTDWATDNQLDEMLIAEAQENDEEGDKAR